MLIRIFSDLHLENCPFFVEYGGEELLIIAGDVCPDENKTLELIKNYLKNENASVLFVLGNHDFYGKTIESTYEFWNSVDLSNFYFLQDESIVLNGIRFYGCTMWTDMNKYNTQTMEKSRELLRDYKEIVNFIPSDSYLLHMKSKNKLLECLQSSKESVVVVSHHLPSYKSVAKQYKNFEAIGSFASNMDDVVTKCYMWIHGHTHHSFDYKIAQTRVVCNPRGRCLPETENIFFDNDFKIQL
jgi:Icc-related predicted phosphoesterase